jgi:hypothetical protein
VDIPEEENQWLLHMIPEQLSMSLEPIMSVKWTRLLVFVLDFFKFCRCSCSEAFYSKMKGPVSLGASVVLFIMMQLL